MSTMQLNEKKCVVSSCSQAMNMSISPSTTVHRNALSTENP